METKNNNFVNFAKNFYMERKAQRYMYNKKLNFIKFKLIITLIVINIVFITGTSRKKRIYE